MFCPDHYFESLDHIPEGFLSDIGVSYAICDIDNTLLRYGDNSASDYAMRFIDKVKKCNIKLLLTTNNRRADRGEMLGEKRIVNAHKPFLTKAKIRSFFSDQNISFNKVIVIGDQIFTDILSGKLLGAKTLLVEPLGETNIPFFGIKRALERPIKNSFIKKYGINK